MELISTPTKIKILDILLQNRQSIGIYTIAKRAKISVSEVWRQISSLINYGLIIEEYKGSLGIYKKYRINYENSLVTLLEEFFTKYKQINKFIHLDPLNACNQVLKKYYITGAYAIKEASWDICYPNGMMIVVDPTEYEQAQLLKNCYINRWNFIILKKSLKNCQYYFDEVDGINKATFEQAVADSIGAYESDPNNVEILYFLLVETLDWFTLRKLIELQWGDATLKRIYLLFTLARVLGGQLYPVNLFRPKINPKNEDSDFVQDAKASCFRILLCNGIAQEQAW
ncbi:MAG: winged helix-turn-helix domain-containing protein [Candidatus Helarchaeota archaeon]